LEGLLTKADPMTDSPTPSCVRCPLQFLEGLLTDAYTVVKRAIRSPSRVPEQLLKGLLAGAPPMVRKAVKISIRTPEQGTLQVSVSFSNKRLTHNAHRVRVVDTRPESRITFLGMCCHGHQSTQNSPRCCPLSLLHMPPYHTLCVAGRLHHLQIIRCCVWLTETAAGHGNHTIVGSGAVHSASTTIPAQVGMLAAAAVTATPIRHACTALVRDPQHRGRAAALITSDVLQASTLAVIHQALEACGDDLRPSRQLLDGFLTLQPDLTSLCLTVEPSLPRVLRLCLQAAAQGRLASPIHTSEAVGKTFDALLALCGNSPVASTALFVSWSQHQ
jgi:hypothetical protein